MSKRRKSKRIRQTERGKTLVLIAICGFLGFAFFGGDKLMSASSNIENYLGFGTLIVLGLLFALGVHLIYKSINR